MVDFDRTQVNLMNQVTRAKTDYSKTRTRLLNGEQLTYMPKFT